ncbi:uncharacterized protein LOC124293002 [Neodiprion lecontei]|uniref:Uncharacterized protein LOC124293002 n=1 Tax=Neodiprion lecontei TaxID=441921 RepID=A0ABM3FIM9_NEOLC|nr:uncharacterized protein LOC124293002 [Neodiprion lecontei]
MKVKTKLGMGCRKPQNVFLNKIIRAAKQSMIPSYDAKTSIKSALKGAREAVKKEGGKHKVRSPRVLQLPRRALTNWDLLKYAKIMKIPYFRGVFMRNEMPKTGPRKNETAVVNLDNKDGPGTHWISYKKRGSDVVYFDSFGHLQPPLDLVKYLGVGSVKYNDEREDFCNVSSVSDGPPNTSEERDIPALSNQIAVFSNLITSLTNKLVGIESTIKVIPKLSEKLDKIENVFGDIASIKEQVSDFDEFHSDVRDCLVRLHSVSNRLDNIEGTTASLSESVDTLSRRAGEIEQRPSPTGVPPLDTRALDRVTQLECALHASDLIITGLPEGHVNDHDQTVLDVAIDRTQILEVRRMRSTKTTEAEPLLSKREFINQAPLIVIDCSKQDKTLKIGPVDI